jgi:hypothetical protein
MGGAVGADTRAIGIAWQPMLPLNFVERSLSSSRRQVMCYVLCVGFWTLAMMDYQRAEVAGVQKAPKHEIAERDESSAAGAIGIWPQSVIVFLVPSGFDSGHNFSVAA